MPEESQAQTVEMWVLSWQHKGRKQKTAVHDNRADAAAAAIELLASDLDLLIFSRAPTQVQVSIQVSTIEQAEESDGA